MLQPDPRSGEGCNTLIHEGFANVNTRKRLLYRHYYIPSFLVQVFTIQLKNNLSKFLAEGFNVHYTTTAIMLARYVTHMNTQSRGGTCYASLEVGWHSRYQPTSTKAYPYRPGSDFLKSSYIYPNAIVESCF